MSGDQMDPEELQQIRTKTNKITDESLESTRRMLQLCDESQNAGAKTLEMLHQQGEQLDHVEEAMDKINEDMREAEKNLTGMEKCCGICVIPCKKSSEFKEDTNTWATTDGKRVIDNQPQRGGIEVRDRTMTDSVSPEGGYIARITNDDREDEMNENMGQVSSMLGNLKNMAIDMGSEIEGQNNQIDRINMKAQSNDTRIAMANQRAGKLIKQ